MTYNPEDFVRKEDGSYEWTGRNPEYMIDEGTLMASRATDSDKPEDRRTQILRRRAEIKAETDRRARIEEIKARRQAISQSQNFAGPYQEGFDPNSGEQAPPTARDQMYSELESNEQKRNVPWHLQPGGQARPIIAAADLARLAVTGFYGTAAMGARSLPGIYEGLREDHLAGEKLDVKGEVDKAADRFNSYAEKHDWLVTPETESLDDIFESVGPYALTVDNWIRNGAETVAGGDPEGATFNYSLLTGLAELFGWSKLTKRGRPHTPRGIRRRREREMRAMAAKYGVVLTQKDFESSFIQGFRDRGDFAKRGAHSTDLRNQVDQRRALSRIEREKALAHAREIDAAVKAGDAVAFGKALEKSFLGQSIDLGEMPQVQKILSDIQNLEVQSPLALGPRIPKGKPDNIVDQQVAGGTRRVRVDNNEAPALILPQKVRAELDAKQVAKAAETQVKLNELNAIYDRIDARLVPDANIDGVPVTLNEQAVLRATKGQLDSWLQRMHVNDMIEGDPGSLAAWKHARNLQQRHAELFTDNKIVQQLVDLEADPETIYKYIMGANQSSPAGHATKVIRKLKEILGDDHPSIAGIKVDFMHEVIKPLMGKDGPNYHQFLKNLDTHVTDNHSLLKVLGIGQDQIDELQAFGRVAELVADSGSKGAEVMNKTFIGSAIARLAVGHSIAKAGVRVGLARRAAHVIMGADLMTQKEIMYQLANAKDGVVIPKYSAAHMAVAEGAFLNDWQHSVREAQEEKQREDKARAARK